MIDRLIISADEKTYFKEYLKIVVEAWKKFFPEVKVSLAFVTNEKSINPAFLEIDNLEVTNFPIIPNLPISNQAKMARHYLACSYGEDVVSIEDIDTIPMQRQWFEDKFSKRTKETILFVGKDVYNGTIHEGKCPISTMTSESFLFEKMINPNKLDWEDFIKSLIGLRVYDNKEDITAVNFSDESTIRALAKNKNIKFTDINRGVNVRTDWIDRSWWSIDEMKMKNLGYVTCNFLRPFSSNFSKIQPVVDFIFDHQVHPSSTIFKLKDKK